MTLITKRMIQAEYNRQNELMEAAGESVGIDSYFTNLGFDPDELQEAAMSYANSLLVGATLEKVREAFENDADPMLEMAKVLEPDTVLACLAASFTRGLTVGVELGR